MDIATYSKLYGSQAITALLEGHVISPKESVKRARREINYWDGTSEGLFATVVLTCDDFLEPKEEVVVAPTQDEDPQANNARRFLGMACKLPMELQMILCRRAFGESEDSFKVDDTTEALCTVFKLFSVHSCDG
jgi:hypothetical protein